MRKLILMMGVAGTLALYSCEEQQRGSEFAETEEREPIGEEQEFEEEQGMGEERQFEEDQQLYEEEGVIEEGDQPDMAPEGTADEGAEAEGDEDIYNEPFEEDL